MSVTELQPPPEAPGPDRTPPHDIAAEQSVLGAMLLSKDAIADVVEVLREGDFYRPVHQIVYSAILDLYGRGEPADAVTVAADLTKNGDIARVGGAPYLHTLVAMVPTAANANYYGRIVREQAILRRLVEAGTRIVQMGYAGTGEVDDMVDHPCGVGIGVSRASALPMAGRAATMMSWPGWSPLVRASRSAKPVGTPTISPPRLEIASISFNASPMMSLSGA